MVEDFGLMVGVVIVGAYLPEGWPSALTTRRPRRSRPQGALRQLLHSAAGRRRSRVALPGEADYVAAGFGKFDADLVDIA